MSVLLDVALRAALLCMYVLVPGWAALRLLRFASGSRVETLLACLVLGCAWTAELVTLLLFAGAYVRVTALLVLVVPAGYLLLARGQRRVAEPPEPLPTPPVSGIDRAVLVAVAAFIGVYLVDAASSPMTWWDGLASWGKWAPDWGRRTSSHGYLVGGYPQLVPRLVSVLYKLTGTHSDILPLDFFAAHVVHVLFAAWFTLAAARLSALCAVPVWPALLAGTGSILFREHIGAGTVDVLVAAQVTTLLALYLGHVRGTWRTAYPAWWVLGSSVFGALFTKLTGIVGPAFMLLWRSPVCRHFGCADPGALRRVTWAAAGFGLVLFLPFVAEQGITELGLRRFSPDVREVNLSIRQIPALLAHDAEVTYRGGGLGARPHLIQLRFWNSYDVPATLRIVFTAGLLACLGLSLLTWFGRATLPLLLPYVAVWALWSSYDQRNLFPVLPMLGLAAAFGGQRAWGLRPHFVWRNGVALFCGLFLVLAGGSLLKELQARVVSLRSGPLTLSARLAAMSGDASARIHRFFPALGEDYEFAREVARRTSATHVLVTSPMFRFFPNGAHALSLWPYERVQSGDLFAGHEWHRPPPNPGWVLLRQGARHRFWAFEPGLRDVTAAPDAPPVGGARSWTHAEDRPLAADEILLWEARVTPGGSGGAAYEGRAGVTDPFITSCAVGDPRDGDTGLTLSGLIAPRGPAAMPVVVRIWSTSADAKLVSLRVARRVSPQALGAPRPGPASESGTTTCERTAPPDPAAGTDR